MAESLAELVTLLADQPTVETRDCFFRALSSSKVAIPLQSPPNDQITFPETQGPDGRRWLLVYCDAQAMARNTGHAWAEVPGRVVLEVAQANGMGIIVQNHLGNTPTWSGVSPGDVVHILSSGNAQG
jgi:hypothetical protein